MSFASLSIDELARRCAEETEKFARRTPSDDLFCFELLRRALADGASEAFTRIYQIYERRVLGWVLGHGRFQQTGEEATYFVSSAWSAFYFRMRGPAFAGFAGLAPALAYLKVCVHTEIMQHLRAQRGPGTLPLGATLDPAHTPDLGSGAATQEIWRRIVMLLPDEQDQLLARAMFVEGRPPRQIVAAYPGRWHDERAVSVDIFRIRKLLRKDPELRRWFGLEGDAEDELGS
jgi:hypothetical protein